MIKNIEKMGADNMSKFYGDSMKIELYTCEGGLYLFKKGRNFGAWNESSQSYTDANKNIKILVDKTDIVEVDDGYDVINIESVKIIG
jgi:hypothetical protein